MTLKKRIIIFSFLVLFLTIFFGSGMDILALRKEQASALNLRSQGLAMAVKSQVEKALTPRGDLGRLSDVSQKCRDFLAGNTEISYCVVADHGGRVLFANDPRFLSFPARPVAGEWSRQQTALLARERVAIVLDGVKSYFVDSAVLVVAPDGSPIGTAHVGFNERILVDKSREMLLKTLFVLGISLLVSFSLVLFFVNKYVMRPISTLLKGVQQISAGALDTRIGEVSVFEFNELARNVNLMSQSLESRDQQIIQSYQEMSHTLEELHASYLKLEKLSCDLERSEELYKSLLRDASDAIVVVGADDSIRMVNTMAEELTGYQANELLGLPLTKMLLLLNIGNIPKLLNIFREAAGGAHIAREVQLSKKGGGVMVAMLHASSIKSGAENLVQAILRDVTREHEIMANLEQSSADLARLNRMKDSFLGLASHELKTPLTVIMGYSELIVSDLADRVDKPVLEMIKNIANAAKRLDNIVKDMVDVSRLDAGRLQLKREEIQLNRLVEESVNELRFFFSMRNQEVALNLDESIPALSGDRLRLMQLLSNILGNAIKFTPDGGRITVATSAKYLLRGVAAGSDQAGREHHLFLEIAVTDTGIGIDREEQLRIFEKFYEVGNIQEHSSGKVAFKAKGAGLGLSIAKGIADMHGGEIWVESTGYNPERFPGSTFHILLPLAPELGEQAGDYSQLLG